MNGHERAFVAPVETALEEYIQQVSAPLLKTCPQDLRPIWKSSGQFYFPNHNSTIHFAGSNSKSYNKLRGYRFDDADVDEAGYIDDLKELVEGVLTPAVFDSNGFLRLSSSAPEEPNHPFDDYWAKALIDGYGVEFNIHDAGYPKEQVNEWVEEMGGWDAPMVQREFLCRSVVDPERRVVPEWKKQFINLFGRDPYYKFYHHYIGIDWGYKDFTAVVFATYNFRKARLEVDGELTFSGTQVRADLIYEAIKLKTKKMWGDAEVYRMVSDSADPILINEINKFPEMIFSPVKKAHTLEAMFNEFRIMVSQEKIYVNPQCVKLISDLEAGVWDKNRKALNRDPYNHHFDHLMALVYLTRMLDMSTNPIPRDFMIDNVRVIELDFDRKRANTGSGQALQSVFGGRK